MPIAALDEPQVFGVRLASGMAEAKLQADGSVVVDNIPLFAEIRPDDPGVKDGMRSPRDRAWLEKAVTNTRARIANGKRPIMTLRHYFDAPERVGVYEPTKIEAAEVNPGEQPRAVVFGRKIYESREAFEKAKDYDFRSIEISPDAPEEFSALALLRDKEPYHKFPNLRERLAQAGVGAAEAFSALCFRAMVEHAAQVWKSAPEAFEACPPKGTGYEGQHKKEGGMPGTETKADAKADEVKSLHERMGALEASHKQLFEMISKVHESVAGKAEEKAEGEKKPEAAEEKPETKAEEKKEQKADAHAALGPNAGLPPAVQEARGPSFMIPETFAAKMAVQDTTILGLRAKIEQMERKEAAAAIVAGARKALLDCGVPSVPESFEAVAFKAAVDGGQPAVNVLLENVKLGMGLLRRGPEAYGAMGPVAGAAGRASDDERKKAIETFASRPENAHKIPVIEKAFHEYMQVPEGVRRSFKDGFLDLCRGVPSINDGALEGRIIRG